MARPETLFGGMLEFACSSTNAHHSRAGSTAEKRALALCGILTKRHDSADCCESANKAFYDCESANKALCQIYSKVIIIIIVGGGVFFPGSPPLPWDPRRAAINSYPYNVQIAIY